MRLLLVEDHADTREVFAALLRRRGHPVDSARSLAEAKACLSAGLSWDAAVVDRHLPDGDGRELGSHLTAAGVPAVVLSALAYEADVAESLAAGFAAHVAKPVNLDELLATVVTASERCRPQPPASGIPELRPS